MHDPVGSEEVDGFEDRLGSAQLSRVRDGEKPGRPDPGERLEELPRGRGDLIAVEAEADHTLPCSGDGKVRNGKRVVQTDASVGGQHEPEPTTVRSRSGRPRLQHHVGGGAGVAESPLEQSRPDRQLEPDHTVGCRISDDLVDDPHHVVFALQARCRCDDRVHEVAERAVTRRPRDGSPVTGRQLVERRGPDRTVEVQVEVRLRQGSQRTPPVQRRPEIPSMGLPVGCHCDVAASRGAPRVRASTRWT